MRLKENPHSLLQLTSLVWPPAVSTQPPCPRPPGPDQFKTAFSFQIFINHRFVIKFTLLSPFVLIHHLNRKLKLLGTLRDSLSVFPFFFVYCSATLPTLKGMPGRNDKVSVFVFMYVLF